MSRTDAVVGLSSPSRGGLNTGGIGLLVLLAISVPCFITLPWSTARERFEDLAVLDVDSAYALPPGMTHPMGTDQLGRSLLWRCLLGGAISLGIGVCAAVLSLAIGVTWGAVAGMAGGRADALLMRIVDVLYGLPYILLVVLLDMALTPMVEHALSWLAADTAAAVADVTTLLLAIGGLSWLTMARVVRGQVLSLREQPFIEAARACGVGPLGILGRHLLPNLVGPIVVYATLTVPAAILAESMLSFLGIGVQPPLPSWGNLATAGVAELHALGRHGGALRWWLPLWPCLLLGLTLLALNLCGDRLRDRFDPRATRG